LSLWSALSRLPSTARGFPQRRCRLPSRASSSDPRSYSLAQVGSPLFPRGFSCCHKRYARSIYRRPVVSTNLSTNLKLSARVRKAQAQESETNASPPQATQKQETMSSLSASRLIGVLAIAVCTLCASAAVLASNEETQLSKSLTEEALTSKQEARILFNMLHSESRQASSTRRRPEIAMSSSLFFDRLKGRWMYSYTSTAELNRLAAPTDIPHTIRRRINRRGATPRHPLRSRLTRQKESMSSRLRLGILDNTVRR
jgi:hypothetical protein